MSYVFGCDEWKKKVPKKKVRVKKSNITTDEVPHVFGLYHARRVASTYPRFVAYSTKTRFLFTNETLSGGTHRIFRVTTSLQLTGNQCCSIGEVWSQRNTLCERVSPSDSGKQMGLLIGEVVSVRECSTRSGLCYAYRKCWWEPETNRKTELVAAAGDWPIVIRDFPLSALRGWQ